MDGPHSSQEPTPQSPQQDHPWTNQVQQKWCSWKATWSKPVLFVTARVLPLKALVFDLFPSRPQKVKIVSEVIRGKTFHENTCEISPLFIICLKCVRKLAPLQGWGVKDSSEGSSGSRAPSSSSEPWPWCQTMWTPRLLLCTIARVSKAAGWPKGCLDNKWSYYSETSGVGAHKKEAEQRPGTGCDLWKGS